MVHVRSWQVAYQGHMPDAFLAALDIEERAEMWRRVTQTPEKQVFVAEDADGELAGFCALTPSRDADARAGTGEVVAIYVHPERWRNGHGRTLLAAALDQARTLHYSDVTLWVLEANHRARSFYESFDFALDGAEKNDDHWGDFVIREVRYRLRLRAA
jgi:GNAT superfamily N-acetyltransferase